MSKKILIIEDEEALVKNLELALKDDFEVKSSQLGKEGLKLVSKFQPDLILLDIMLPDTTGSDILQELKKKKETELIHVIVLTNLADSQTVSNILAAGGRDYLVKADWSIQDIVSKIKESLE